MKKYEVLSLERKGQCIWKEEVEFNFRHVKQGRAKEEQLRLKRVTGLTHGAETRKQPWTQDYSIWTGYLTPPGMCVLHT